MFDSIRLLFRWESVEAGLSTISRARLRLGNGPVSSEARHAGMGPAVPSSKLPCVCMLGRVQLCVTPWTVARQAPLSTEFFKQEHWSGLPFPPPGDLPDLCIKCMSLAAPVLAGRFLTAGPAGKCLSFLRRRPVHSLLFTLTASLVRAFSPSTNQPTNHPTT